VVNRFAARGTHNGTLLGLAPTGKQVTVTGIGMSRFAGGKIMEEWTNYDVLGMLQQLGAVPQMAPVGV
jgi:predicted ester cyclase